MTGLRELRAALRRTWAPFFSRFGQLTDVQLRAVPELLAGRNLVVISPAASGKTEAAVAPIVERQLDAGREEDRLAVLYVSPTRALVNDLFRRLAGPLGQLDLKVGRKTGDHPAVEESRLPFLLITTPESFDSLLCRHPRIFKGLGAVILDELHLLDNTPRGDQLRVLLERMRLINPDVQHCALSATIDDQDIGRRYFSSPVVVNIPSSREIEQVLVQMDDRWPHTVVDELRRRECRKVLCFFNARSLAEGASRRLDLPPFKGRVWVHHASLTRHVREQVEELMNRQRTGLLCCTSTLELGIDIGDIDAVVLVRPPFNVASLLQRIGRGNRRRASYLLAIGLFDDPWERVLFETLFECARQGRLYERRYTPSLSVVPQQIVSYMFQRRRIGTTLDSLRRVFTGPGFERLPVERVFRHMVDHGHIVCRRAVVHFLASSLERQIESGRIHSNIQDKSFGQYEVHDVTTGQHVGTVFFVLEHFVLAGRTWETVRRDEKEKRLLVRPLATVATGTKVFEGTGTGGYGYRLAAVLKSRLMPELEPRQFPYFLEEGQAYIVHLLGSTCGSLLAEALSEQGVGAADVDGKVLVLAERHLGRHKKAIPVPGMSAVRKAVGRNLSRLEDSLGSGAFFEFLPPELQVEDHLLTLDAAGLLEFLNGVELVEMSANKVSRRLFGREGVDNGREPARF
ncbi:MAG: DEAD/DEAH box helicase [candidate division WOR-3 bacterium]